MGLAVGVGVVTVTVTDPTEPPPLDTEICAVPDPTDKTVNVAGALTAVSGLTVATFVLPGATVYGGVPPFTMNEPDWPMSEKVSVAGVTVIPVSDFFRVAGVGVGVTGGIARGVAAGATALAARVESAAGGEAGPSGAGPLDGCTAAGEMPNTAHSMTTENPAAPTCCNMFTPEHKLTGLKSS